MKVTAIKVWQKDLPLRKPYWLSGGRLKFEVLDSTFVKIETDEGLEGWGEGCPWGNSYLPAYGGGIRSGIGLLAPALLGQDPRYLAKINRIMDKTLPGHPYIKSAIDIACWDILGKAAGLSLCELLGGPEAGGRPIASSVSTGSPQEMVAEVECFRALGYRVHSCKVGADVDLDIARIEALAAARAPEETIFYDVNRAWLPWEAITVMNRLQGLPGFFEQPCETFAESAQVRAHTSQPISLDEGIKTFDDLQYAQEQGLCEIVNIKIGRVGGLTKARLMRDFCLAKGMAMLIMETGGTVVADTAVAHLSQSIPAESCLGTWSCQEMITPDPARGLGARNEAGCLTLPDAPGLGVAPAADFLGEPSAVYS